MISVRFSTIGDDVFFATPDFLPSTAGVAACGDVDQLPSPIG